MTLTQSASQSASYTLVKFQIDKVRGKRIGLRGAIAIARARALFKEISLTARYQISEKDIHPQEYFFR